MGPQPSQLGSGAIPGSGGAGIGGARRGRQVSERKGGTGQGPGLHEVGSSELSLTRRQGFFFFVLISGSGLAQGEECGNAELEGCVGKERRLGV